MKYQVKLNYVLDQDHTHRYSSECTKLVKYQGEAGIIIEAVSLEALRSEVNDALAAAAVIMKTSGFDEQSFMAVVNELLGINETSNAVFLHESDISERNKVYEGLLSDMA